MTEFFRAIGVIGGGTILFTALCGLPLGLVGTALGIIVWHITRETRSGASNP